MFDPLTPSAAQSASHAVADPIAGVARAVGAAATVDRAGWSAPARSTAVVELVAARERLDALLLEVIGEWDRNGAWALDGAASPVAWLAHRLPLTRQEASVLVRSARHVARNQRTAKALEAGDITAAHVGIAAKAARHRDARYAEHEDLILDAARELSPARFRAVMQYWCACAESVDDAAPRDDDANRLDVATTFEGVGHLEGRLDPLSVKALIDRLDALEPPDPGDGSRPPRTIAQRRAAALVRLVCGDRAPDLTLDVMVDEATLAGRPPTDPTEGCCDLVGYGPISPPLARTPACDAAIGRVVMRGPSEVLDVGRRTRLVSPALRRALGVRDRGCVEPGCTAPAAWCDAHHVVHWTAHGPTDLENLELRCRRHHLLQHRRDEHAARHARE